MTHPVPKLYVDGGPARRVLGGAATAFHAIAYDSTGVVRKNADITWSFGDGGQEKGEEVFYAYKKPGEYTAVVRARDKGVTAVALIPVAVTESEVYIDSVTDDGIAISNGSAALADLSGWKVRIGSKTVKLPADTVIDGKGTAFLPFENLKVASSSELALQFPNGRIAHAYTQPNGEDPELYQLQEKVPVQSLGVVTPKTYAHAVAAPAREAVPQVAGASVTQDVVILKDEQGVLDGVGSFMASVVTAVAGIFSR